MADQDHEPDHANWNCRACSHPYPCAPARQEMLQTMTPTELRIRQWMDLESAIGTLQPMSHRQAWDRFLGWAGNPPV